MECDIGLMYAIQSNSGTLSRSVARGLTLVISTSSSLFSMIDDSLELCSQNVLSVRTSDHHSDEVLHAEIQ